MLRAEAWPILPALLASAPLVRAQPEGGTPELTLKWDAPAECPTGATVAQDIERLLGRPLSATSQRPLQADAALAQQAGAWQLRLQVTAGDAGARERALAGGDCAQLAEAAAVIIALAIDPDLKIELPEEAPAAGTQPRPEPEAPSDPPVAELAPPVAAVAVEQPLPTSTPPEPIPPPAPPTEPLVWRLGASALVDGLSLPKAAPGVELHGGAEWSPIRVELFGLHLFEQRQDVAGSAVGIVSLTAGGLRTCVEVRESAFSVGPCVSTEVGVLAARSEQVSSPDRGTSLWWGIGAGVRAGWHVSSVWEIELGAEVVLPMTRDRFVIEGVNEVVHQSPDATIRGFLGVTRRFR